MSRFFTLPLPMCYLESKVGGTSCGLRLLFSTQHRVVGCFFIFSGARGEINMCRDGVEDHIALFQATFPIHLIPSLSPGSIFVCMRTLKLDTNSIGLYISTVNYHKSLHQISENSTFSSLCFFVPHTKRSEFFSLFHWTLPQKIRHMLGTPISWSPGSNNAFYPSSFAFPGGSASFAKVCRLMTSMVMPQKTTLK